MSNFGFENDYYIEEGKFLIKNHIGGIFMNSHKKLIVWQKSKKLAVDLYKLTEDLPYKSRFIVDQMNRAAASISSNISEGHGRGSTKDYIKFLFIARGSLYELSTQMEICTDIYPFLKEQMVSQFNICNEISRMLNSLIKSLKLKLHLRKKH